MRALVLWVLLVTFASFSGCRATTKVRIVATTDMVADMVRGIVPPENADVTVLIPSGTDPHMAVLSEEQKELVRNADLVVANGLDLEANMLPELQATAVDFYGVGTGLLSRANQTTLLILGEQGKPDPHVWHDPDLWVQLGSSLAKRIENKWPSLAPQCKERFSAWKAEVLEAGSEARLLLSEVEPEYRILITSHRGYRYFARAYGFTMLIPEDLKTPRSTLRWIPSCVFGEADVSEPQLTPRQAREKGVPNFLEGEQLHTHSLPRKPSGGTMTYAEWIVDNAGWIHDYRFEYGFRELQSDRR